MTMTRAAWLSVALLILAAMEAAAAEPRRVLLLHSFGHAHSPWSDMAGSFRAELIRKSPTPIDLYEVSLDTARVQGRHGEGPFVEYIRAVLAGRKLDLIVPVGAPAALFMQRHRPLLFPTAPMLIVGADVRRIPDTTRTKNDTSVVLDVNLPAFLNNILRLRPETSEIAIVIGTSPVERFWASELRREFQPFAGRVKITWFNDLTLGEMLKRAATMPPQSAILWYLLSEDAVGVPYSQDRALDAIREVAAVPIFGIGDYQLGRGIVGGPLMQTRVLGQEAAEVALRILDGATPGDINPPAVVFGAPMYDWRELRRWNIKETLLPAGSTVHFREPTVWEQYRWQIILVAMALLAQALAIAGLFYQRRLRGIADAGLKQSEARMGVVAASTDTGLWQHDLSTGHLWATEHCLSMFGLAAGSRLSPEAFLGAIHPDDRAIATAAMRSTPSTGELSRRRGEFRVERPGGDVRWYLVTAHTDVDEQGAPIRVSGIFRDVTARRKAEEDAERLSERLETLQDEERQRIASELHDSTTQHLVAMTLNLTSLRSRVAAPNEALELLDEIDSSLEEAAKELRTFTYLLHPPRLESEGLRATLQRYVDGFGRRTELKTSLRASRGADQLPLPLGRSMLRIVQEALTNVHRHAAATRVYVRVRLIGKQVHLVIKDDGQGFEEASGRRDSHPPRVGVGIAGMTARMQQLGGKLDIRSGPKGTTVHAVVHLG